jgi:hypothetical protein
MGANASRFLFYGVMKSEIMEGAEKYSHDLIFLVSEKSTAVSFSVHPG